MKTKLALLLLLLLVAATSSLRAQDPNSTQAQVNAASTPVDTDDDESSGKNHLGIRVGTGDNSSIEASFRHKFIALLQMEADAGYQWDDAYSLYGVSAALHLKLPVLFGIQVFAGPGMGFNNVKPEAGGESGWAGVGFLQVGLQFHFTVVQFSADAKYQDNLFNDIPAYEGSKWNGALGIRLRM